MTKRLPPGLLRGTTGPPRHPWINGPVASIDPYAPGFEPQPLYDLGSFGQHRQEAHHHELRHRLAQLRRRRRRP